MDALFYNSMHQRGILDCCFLYKVVFIPQLLFILKSSLNIFGKIRLITKFSLTKYQFVHFVYIQKERDN
jgi:hypothetical protein